MKKKKATGCRYVVDGGDEKIPVANRAAAIREAKFIAKQGAPVEVLCHRQRNGRRSTTVIWSNLDDVLE